MALAWVGGRCAGFPWPASAAGEMRAGGTGRMNMAPHRAPVHPSSSGMDRRPSNARRLNKSAPRLLLGWLSLSVLCLKRGSMIKRRVECHRGNEGTTIAKMHNI